jgi:lipopolysaccharide export system permease protein
MKKLDKLVLKAFVGPFIATFFLAIFVLVLQFFWLWIDDFVGKGIDMGTLATVIMYVAGSWVPVALPLAILLSTIMTFGNLGESYETVAIKSAGISLGRFMRPILVASIFISGLAFFFNNNVIPVINLRLNRLKYEIVYTKPAFDIKPGVFYNKIDGYIIKLGKKDADGQNIKDILIFEKGNYLQDNLIVADSGVMRVSNDKRFLEFDLRSGSRYEERGPRNTINTELISIHFSQYKKVFDLTSFFKVKTSDSLFKDHYRMLSTRQLTVFIDSIRHRRDSLATRISRQTTAYHKFAAFFDTATVKTRPPAKKPKSMKEIIPDSAQAMVVDMAYSALGSAKSEFDMLQYDYSERARDLRHYQLAWHQKFSLSAACFVLFLIGAPLGSIIRKGGLGSPLVFAVIFFVTFHLLNTLGEKMVKEGVLSPIAGTWLPCYALIPVGLFLTYKASHDSQLFNKEFYYRTFNRVKQFINQYRLRRNPPVNQSNNNEPPQFS